MTDKKIKMFNLQFFSEEAVDVDESEEVDVDDDFLDELEDDEDMPTDESDDEPAEDDFTEANKAFLDRFEFAFDGKPTKFETMEQLIEAAQEHSALPRYKEKLSAYENNSAYKYIDEYMTDNGFQGDPDGFMQQLKINEKTAELVADGVSDEKAKKMAEEHVKSTFKVGDTAQDKQVAELVKWNADRVESGKSQIQLDPKNIPESVLKDYKNGKPLKEAYLEYELENAKEMTQQETIKKINQSKKTSSGPLQQSTKAKEVTLTADQINTKLNGMTSAQQDKYTDDNWDMIEKSGYFKKF